MKPDVTLDVQMLAIVFYIKQERKKTIKFINKNDLKIILKNYNFVRDFIYIFKIP